MVHLILFKGVYIVAKEVAWSTRHPVAAHAIKAFLNAFLSTLGGTAVVFTGKSLTEARTYALALAISAVAAGISAACRSLERSIDGGDKL